jgi:hypothetical protein
MKKFIAMAITMLFVTVGQGWAWTVPGTGVTKCYDNENEILCPSVGQPFYGQDGNYSNAQSFTNTDNNIVTDNVTGLSWVKTPETTYRVWTDASIYCDQLAVGGYDDWRLPNIRELFTIVDAARSNPSSDPIFTTQSYAYWSRTPHSVNAINAWGGAFNYGALTILGKSGDYNVRCVRGGQLVDSLFVDNFDGTVTDKSTNLLWEQSQSTQVMDWQSALNYCQSQVTGGYSDWRLPNKKELESLVDFSRDSPAINPAFGINSGLDHNFWASTTSADENSQAWLVHFYLGHSSLLLKTYPFSVRCVRTLPADTYPDADGDGVPDSNDQCPSTPENTPVNRHGCPDRRAVVIPLMSN